MKNTSDSSALSSDGRHLPSPVATCPVATCKRSGTFEEVFTSFSLDPEMSLADVLEQCQTFATEAGAVPVKVHLFYPKSRRQEAAEAAATTSLPVMWTESKDAADATHRAGGVFVHAVHCESSQVLWHNGRQVGLRFQDEHAEYVFISGLYGTNGTESEQTLEVFAALEELLAGAGMDYSHILRTWFYNRDILSWYGEFNKVRTRFYEKHGVFEHLLPASTGIGADNPHGSALVVSAFAVKDLSGHCQCREVASPLQCPATDYGSSFARAVRLDTPEHARLTISGTASIGADGSTVYVGDFRRQFDETHRVVAAILEAEGFAWKDVVRGIAYFRHAEDAKLAEELSWPEPFPVIRTVDTVCRDDLLYELEINAVKSKV